MLDLGICTLTRSRRTSAVLFGGEVTNMQFTFQPFFPLLKKVYHWIRSKGMLPTCGRNMRPARSHAVTSNSNLELPKLVRCFCQKLSGLIISATWMQQGKDSCKIFKSGFIESHLDPRISTITVKPRLHTSSLENKKTAIRMSTVTSAILATLPAFLHSTRIFPAQGKCLARNLHKITECNRQTSGQDQFKLCGWLLNKWASSCNIGMLRNNTLKRIKSWPGYYFLSVCHFFTFTAAQLVHWSAESSCVPLKPSPKSTFWTQRHSQIPLECCHSKKVPVYYP